MSNPHNIPSNASLCFQQPNDAPYPGIFNFKAHTIAAWLFDDLLVSGKAINAKEHTVVDDNDIRSLLTWRFISPLVHDHAQCYPNCNHIDRAV